jgi:hyperosmotically inducible periplasmic protein
MKRNWMSLVALSFALAPSMIAQTEAGQSVSPSEARIQKEVRHELLMLPYFTVFDYIAYQVKGDTVTLQGEVTRPSLKSDAENVVKRIEGVQQVINNIEILPPSPMDDQLRLALYRAIYGYPALEKYALGVQKPIRIIHRPVIALCRVLADQQQISYLLIDEIVIPLQVLFIDLEFRRGSKKMHDLVGTLNSFVGLHVVYRLIGAPVLGCHEVLLGKLRTGLGVGW